MQRKNSAHLVLIAGLAFVFLVFGVEKLTTPIVWIQWIPSWMEGLLGMSRDLWLTIIGITEIVFGLMLLLPIRRVRQVASVLIIGHLLVILTQTGWNDIAVRDIGLLMSAVALLLLL